MLYIHSSKSLDFSHWETLTVFFFQILAFYDLIVTIGCTAMYALPNEWAHYKWKIHPHLLPWLLPITQIAMMSSVYCTVVMSFERYVRICHICQLRGSNYLTEENFKYYILAFTLGPFLFYAPKFFEIKTEYKTHFYKRDLNCTSVLMNSLASILENKVK